MKLYKNTEWKEIKLNGEIIEIPNDWNNNNLQKLSYITDGTHSSPKTIKNTDFHYLTVRDLDWHGNIDFENAERVSKEDYDKMVKNNCSPIKNDILLSKDGTVGKTAIYDTNLKSVILSSLAIIRFNNINYKYGYFLFKHSHAKEHLFDHKNGNAIKRIVLKQLNAFEIFYPSDKEQSAIASILSTQESIVSKTKDLIAQLDKRNQFMMDELLSGRLRVKEENGQPIFYKNSDDNWQSVKINGDDVDIPKDWDKEHLGTSKIPFIKTGVKNYDGELEYYATGEVDDFQLGNKPTGLFTYKEKPSRANVKVLDNSIYLARMKNTLKIIKFEKSKNILLSTGFLGLLPNIQFVNLDFLYHVIKSDYFQTAKNKECKGATQETLSDGGAKKIEIILPKISEQQLISKVLNILFEEKDKYQEILEKEEKTFTFLLEELMSGRLRIEI